MNFSRSTREDDLRIRIENLETEVSKRNSEINKLTDHIHDLKDRLSWITEWIGSSHYSVFINAAGSLSIARYNIDNKSRIIVATKDQNDDIKLSLDYDRLSNEEKLEVTGIIHLLDSTTRVEPLPYENPESLGKLLSIRRHCDYYYDLIQKGSIRCVIIHKVFMMGNDCKVESNLYETYEGISNHEKSLNPEEMEIVKEFLDDPEDITERN